MRTFICILLIGVLHILVVEHVISPNSIPAVLHILLAAFGALAFIQDFAEIGRK